MARVLYPGSFDPVTNGHLDVLQRASRLFDEVIVAVAHHNSKQALLSVAQRVHLLKRSAGHLANVRITSFEGLLVNFAREQGAQALIRGLRAVSDFEFEFQMALMNRKLEPRLETVYLTPKEDYTYLSSRIMKEVARFGGDVSQLTPSCVAERLARMRVRSQDAE